jgi:hypothetical protein
MRLTLLRDLKAAADEVRPCEPAQRLQPELPPLERDADEGQTAASRADQVRLIVTKTRRIKVVTLVKRRRRRAAP